MEYQQRDYEQQEDNQPVIHDSQVSAKILRVNSKTSERIVSVEVKDKDGKIIGYKNVKITLPYTEVLTEDLATAFTDETDRAVLNAIQNALSLTMSFAENYEEDMTNSYNLMANFHNMYVVSSKAGKAAKVAKSMYTEERKNYSMASKGTKDSVFSSFLPK